MNWAALYAILSKKINDISALQMKKVTELPETGETNTLYLVPKTTAEEGNYSDEYIWDADLEDFEKVGDTLVISEDEIVYYLGVYYALSGEKWIALSNNKTINDIVNDINNGKYPIIKAGGRLYYLDTISTLAGELEFKCSYLVTDGGLRQLTIRKAIPRYNVPSRLDVSEWIQDSSVPNANPNIATSYSTTATYDLGDLVIYNDKLYECTTAITVAEAWTAAHWTQVNVSDELDKKANLTDIPTDYTKDTATAPLYDSTATYAVGDICMYQKELYKCNTAIDPAEEWDSTHWTKTDILSEMPTPVPAVTDYAKDSSVAPLYDSTATYALGDLVMHDKELYKCTTAISTAEAWDSTHWTKTDVLSEMPDGLPASTSLGKILTSDGNGGWKSYFAISVFRANLTSNTTAILTDELDYNNIRKVLLNSLNMVAIKLTYGLSDSALCFYNAKTIDGYNCDTFTGIDPIKNRLYVLYHRSGKTDLNIRTFDVRTFRIANSESLALPYVTTAIYNEGNITTYNGTLYKCKQDNVTGNWNSSKWDTITVLDVIDSKISDAVTSVLNTSF